MGADRKPEFFAGKDVRSRNHWPRLRGFAAGAALLRYGTARHGIRPRSHESGKAERRQDPTSSTSRPTRSRSTSRARRFCATSDFTAPARCGCRADLRAHSDRRTARARSELRGKHRHRHRSSSSAQPVDRARKHHLSRNHRRIGAAHPRKSQRPEMPHHQRRRSRKCQDRFLPGLFSRARRSRQQAIRPGADSQSSGRRQSPQRPSRHGLV